MDGVLEKALALGLCKVACGFLSLPALSSSLSSITLCCSCLMLFTDLAVTVFLALLWWTGSSELPLPAAPSDVIAVRFLVFLGHTYGTALLLTVPLVAVDMVCGLMRLQQLGGDKMRTGLKEGQRVGVTMHLSSPTEFCGAQHCHSLETGPNEMDDTPKEPSLHTYGFLSCLAVWIFCGLRGGVDLQLEGEEVEFCMLQSGSLVSCLPDLPTITLDAARDPALVLFGPAVLLVLAVSLIISRKGLIQNPFLVLRMQEVAKTVPGPLLPVRSEMKRHYENNVCLLPITESGKLVFASHEKGQCFVHVQRECPASTCSTHSITRHVTVILDSRDPVQTNSLTRCTAHLQEWGLILGVWVISCSGGWLLTGLVCGVTLCLFPPALSVNILLIRTVEGLAEWTLRNMLSTSSEKTADNQLLLSTLHTERKMGDMGLTVNSSLGKNSSSGL